MATRSDLEVLIREIRHSGDKLDGGFRVLYFYLKGEIKTALRVIEPCTGKLILQDSIKAAEELETKDL